MGYSRKGAPIFIVSYGAPDACGSTLWTSAPRMNCRQKCCSAAKNPFLRLQAEESVPDVKCGDFKLLAEILTAFGGSARIILGFDNDGALLRAAPDFLHSNSLEKNTHLFVIGSLFLAYELPFVFIIQAAFVLLSMIPLIAERATT